MAEIKSLSIRHHEIMDFLMGNPCVKLGDVASKFGVTGAWLSQIIHSDAFQNLLKEKQGIAFHHTILPIREKMTVAANMALDKVIENLHMEPDLRTVADVAEGMLDRLGFGAKPLTGGNLTINQQNNLVALPNTTRDEIAEARALMHARSLGVGVTINGESVPIALPRESMSDLGKAVPVSNLPFAQRSYTEGEVGDQVRAESA